MPLTDALLTRVNLETTQAWLNNQADNESYKPKAQTVLGMLAQQREGATGNFIELLTDNKKDRDVRVIWYDWCGKEAQDCTPGNSCILTGDDVAVKGEDYKITQCIDASFAVDEDEFAKTSLSVQTALANGLRNAIKNILERLDQKAIAVLDASSIYGATLPTATIDDLLEILMQAEIHGIDMPFGVDGGRFFKAYLAASVNRDNADGVGNARLAQMLPMYFDILQFQKAGIPDNTYVMSPYAYAIVHKNYADSEVPTKQRDGKTYHYKFNIPGTPLYVDVLHQENCIDISKNRYRHIVDVKLHYEILINPAGCETGEEGEEVASKGILKFTKEAPAPEPEPEP